MHFEFLTKEDVVEIHQRLVIDAAESDDPISPPGIKDEAILESAISRQQAGYGGRLKYSDPISNAASLCYGLCSNHPLHNGNKRTALVSLLCHLDKNGLTFNSRTNQDKLYTFMLNVASHNIATKRVSKKHRDQSDAEVEAMTDWIRKRTRRIEKGERTVSYIELEKILKDHDVYLENHKGNYVDVMVYKTVVKRTGFFAKESVREGQKVGHIPYWPGRTVGKNLIKSIRHKTKLTHNHGVDSALFYGSETLPDDFIQRYKKVLSRLAKT